MNKKLMLLILVLSLMPFTLLKADTFNVTGTADTIGAGCSFVSTDNFDCPSLREAIIVANTNGSDDEIILEEAVYTITRPGDTETLEENDDTQGDFDITEEADLIIRGPADALATISGGGIERVFHVGEVLVPKPGLSITFNNVRISNGLIDDSDVGDARGAGIYIASNEVDFILNNSEVVNNRNDKASGGSGGGIYTELLNSFIISHSTIANNRVLFGSWGGASVFGVNASLIEYSTISGNQAGDSGGGIRSDEQTTITNSTITNNTASGVGGISGEVNIQNTIVAGNIKSSGPQSLRDINSSQINSLGYNIIGVASTFFFQGEEGDQFGVSNDSGVIESYIHPLLSPLQNNGGLTLSHLPQINSPALDAADPSTCSDSDSDQRGQARNFGSGCDIGAVERQAICGNNSREEDEQCDLGSDNGLFTSTCSSQCSSKSQNTGDPILCGNGVLDNDEVCDNGPDNGSQDNNCNSNCQLSGNNDGDGDGTDQSSGGCQLNKTSQGFFNYLFLSLTLIGLLCVACARQHRAR